MKLVFFTFALLFSGSVAFASAHNESVTFEQAVAKMNADASLYHISKLASLTACNPALAQQLNSNPQLKELLAQLSPKTPTPATPTTPQPAAQK